MTREEEGRIRNAIADLQKIVTRGENPDRIIAEMREKDPDDPLIQYAGAWGAAAGHMSVMATDAQYAIKELERALEVEE